MAKGWESKAVESQVVDSETPSPTKGGKKRAELTPEKIEAYRRREVLLLSRTRVLRDIESSRNARYTEQLNRALADIEAQISKLDEIE